METDAFFYQLFKQLPQTVFELLDLPAERARDYRFDSVELKKALRIDGLFLPSKPELPLYVVEVQYQPLATFYANLFAKVFGYLEENDPAQDWRTVAIFPSRAVEPKQLAPYRDLLRPERVARIYLDEFPMPDDPSPGLGLVQMLSASIGKLPQLASRFRKNADVANVDRDFRVKAIQLFEEMLIRRFPQFTREEIRAMFQLEDLRKTRFWQEAREEGIDEGRVKGLEEGIEKGIEKGVERGLFKARKDFVQKCLAKGMTVKETAELMEISVREVRRLAKDSTK